MKILTVGMLVFMGAAFVLAWGLCRSASQADEAIKRMMADKRHMDERRSS